MSGPRTSEGWIGWFARNSVAANLLMLIILAMGAVTVAGMRTEGFPADPPRDITVTVNFSGASPEDVEEGAAVKVEHALSGLAGLESYSSQISENGAVITVKALPDYPVRQLKAAIKDRVDAISTFPSQVEDTTVSFDLDKSHVIFVQILGGTDHATLKEVTRRTRRALLDLPTVSKVGTFGARGAEITIELREEKLRLYGLTFQDVQQAVQKRSINLSAGTLQAFNGTLRLQSRHQAYFGRDLLDTRLRVSPDGGVVTLSDVAHVVDGFRDEAILSVFRGRPSIRLAVELSANQSITQTSEAVRKKVEELRSAPWMPDAFEIQTWLDEAQSIRGRLTLMSRNALTGMALVFVMLALFLDVRIAFWVAIGIPVSFAGALYVMGPGWFDYSLNDLSTFGFIITLGIVVDDAIVTGESIHAHKRQYGGGVETAIAGALQVATPATFGVLTTVAAFFPLTNIGGELGGPFRMIAVVVILCLLFSLVESKFILPAHLAHLDLTPGPQKWRLARGWHRLQRRLDSGMGWTIRSVYLPVLRAGLKHRIQTLFAFVAAFVFAIGLLTHEVVKTNFFPEGDSTLIQMSVTLESGTVQTRTRAVAEVLEASLTATVKTLEQKYGTKVPPVANYYIGSTSAEQIEFFVALADTANRKFSSGEFVQLWRQAAGKPVGVRQLQVFGLFDGVEDLRVGLSAEDPAEARAALVVLRDALQKMPEVYDLITDLDLETRELYFELRPEGEALGLTNQDVVTQIRSAMFGVDVQDIQRGSETVKVRLRFPKSDRDSFSDLNRLRLRTPNGGSVPLETVVRVQQRERLLHLKRVKGVRVLELSAKVDKTRLSVNDLIQRLDGSVFAQIQSAYGGVKIETSGEAEEEEKATNQLRAGFVFGLLLIYALLAIPLKSYVLPFVIMLAIPFGFVGVVLGHLIIGLPVSLLSFFGILALSGVVVNDALVLVSRYRQNRGSGANVYMSLIEAGQARFRAVLLTSVTTFAGLFPLVLDRSEQAQILIPMAVSLAFGVVFATLITLILIPILLSLSAGLLSEDIDADRQSASHSI